MRRYGYATILLMSLLPACHKTEAPASAVRPVIVVTVKDSAGSGHAVYSGEVRARHEADLGFRIGGKIVERRFNLGDHVRQGQLLARLDPEDQQLSASAATSQVEAARAQFNLSRADYERARALFAQHFISQSGLDSRRSQWQSAQAQLDQAQARQRASFNQVAYTQLKADRDGVVTAAPAEAGQVVAAGQQIVRLADPAQREVLIWLPESRAGSVKVGQNALVQIWGHKDRTYAGKVRELAASADPVTRTYAVRVAVEDADQVFRLGATAMVGLATLASPGQLRVPLSAVVRDGAGQPRLWVVEKGGVVVSRALTDVTYQDDTAIVRGGVRFGDQVVAVGAHMLRAGMHVRVIESQAPVTLDIAR